MIRLLIADDHPVVRQGLVNVIEQDPSFTVVGQIGEGDQVIPEIEKLNPDLILLDISLPGMSGLDILRAARKLKLTARFIILTMYKDREYLEEALDLGARGYIIKDSALNEVLRCLRSVSQGEYYISPELSGHLIDRQSRMQSLSSKMPGLEQLTPGERKILKFIAVNKTNKEIAEELFVSIRTVENHRQNIARKLDLKGPHRLLQFALEHKHDL